MTQDGLTAYGRLANEFWRRIASGEWRPGQRLPTVVQMAESFDVSPATVRAALGVLSRQGLIHARQGRGTFVAAEAGAEPADTARKLDQGYFDAWIVGPSQGVKVLDKSEGAAFPPDIAEGRPCFPDYVFLRRLHLGGGKPVCLVDFYFATEAYRSLPPGIDGQFKVGLLLMTKAEPRPARGRQIVTVAAASHEDAGLLETPPGSPIVSVARLFLDAEGRVLGGGRHRYPGAVFRQVIDQPIDEILDGLGMWLPSENS